jgi:hypothetical protein
MPEPQRRFAILSVIALLFLPQADARKPAAEPASD